jgi:hypothetical protein
MTAKDTPRASPQAFPDAISRLYLFVILLLNRDIQSYQSTTRDVTHPLDGGVCVTPLTRDSRDKSRVGECHASLHG